MADEMKVQVVNEGTLSQEVSVETEKVNVHSWYDGDYTEIYVGNHSASSLTICTKKELVELRDALDALVKKMWITPEELGW